MIVALSTITALFEHSSYFLFKNFNLIQLPAFTVVSSPLLLSPALASDQHFVDLNRTALINQVKDTKYILDKLRELGLILDEAYDAVRAINSERDQMREILKFVCSAGREGKDMFHKVLKRMSNLRPLLSKLEKC